jgi:hypothetical protein
MSEWQPIETAPKDGTTVILFCDRYASPDVADVGSYEQGQWVMNGSGWEPTHWMPLPNPPSA